MSEHAIPEDLKARYLELAQCSVEHLAATLVRVECERDELMEDKNHLLEVCAQLREALARMQGPVTEGCQRITAERKRQIEVEGWTRQHDTDEHELGELASAARSYCHAAEMEMAGGPVALKKPLSWPWDRKWWKPSSDPIRNLEKAGALIAAQIDALLAARAAGEGNDGVD